MNYKLIVKGAYGLTNFGDDALMQVLSFNLKDYFTKDEVIFLCATNSYNKKFSNNFHILETKENKSIEGKVLLYGGGTQFYSFLPKKNIFDIIKILLKDPSRLTAKFNNSNKKITYDKVAALGIGVGPFLKNADPKIEINTKKLFNKMSFIASRDTYSSKKIKEWQINEEELFSDICFLMDNNEYKNESKYIKNIGIIVRDWNLTEEGKCYYNKIELLVNKLKEKNIEVTLIIFAKNADKYWNEIKYKFENILEWDPNNDSIENFMKELSFFDLFITARYHGAIFASLLNIPFISIVVEQKLSLVSDLYQDCSEKWNYPFEINDCLDKVDSLNKNYSENLVKISHITIEQQEKAHKMLDKFINYCKYNNILEKGCHNEN